MTSRLKLHLFLSVGCVVLAASCAQALYIRPMLNNIPIQRLIENLEKHVKNNPKDVQFKHNLARAHAMAYAWNTDTVQILQGKDEKGPWFGYEPRHVPYAIKPPKKGDSKEDPTKHLTKALKWYREVIKAEPKNWTARLGQAWLTQKSGKTDEAKKLYRALIEEAWAKESEMKVAGLGWHSVVAEAAGYLKPLLDKEKDKKEIDKLNARIQKLKTIPRPVTPIVIPLQANLQVHDLVNQEAQVTFDADGTGEQKAWTWITPKAGWLVHDRHGTGKITSALQLFGGVSFWMFWSNGYHALSAFDDNGDGKLTGKELRELAVWQDKNSNGISEPGEVKTLAELDIVELSCRHETVQGKKTHVATSRNGVRFGNGERRDTHDVLLQDQSKQIDPTKQIGDKTREKQARALLLKRHGGDEKTEKAVADGLRWLALHQAPDGHWSLDKFPQHARKKLTDKQYFNDGCKGAAARANDIAGTAFGLLPFLGAGHTHKQGDYKKTVLAGLTYLLKKQKKDGDFGGGMYAHALATQAVCEVAWMTKVPGARASAMMAINYIVKAQDPNLGGWRYQPRRGSDTSVTGFQMAALKAARMAKLPIPKGVWKGADKWLDAAEARQNQIGTGTFGYTTGQPTYTMTSVGLFCRQILGEPLKSPAFVTGTAYLSKYTPATMGQRNCYYLYYATRVMFQLGGESWSKWNLGEDKKPGMKKMLLDSQDSDHDSPGVGSWDPRGDSQASAGGRIMKTSLALLCLETYYRYPRIYDDKKK